MSEKDEMIKALKLYRSLPEGGAATHWSPERRSSLKHKEEEDVCFLGDH